MTDFKKADELVVVVNNRDLFDGVKLRFQGALTDPDTVQLLMDNINEHYFVMRRGSTKETTTPVYKNAELNFECKQPIPYVIIKKGDNFYAYERLSKGGEERLHSKLSIGWGGHQNPLNNSLSTPFDEVVMDNLERELEEELNIQSSSKELKFIGLINDDENEVGEVHIGILALLELAEDATVEVREIEQLRGFWVTAEELLEPFHIYDRLEAWSQIAVDTF